MKQPRAIIDLEGSFGEDFDKLGNPQVAQW